MATIVENDNIKVVKYNNFNSTLFDICIVDKKDDNEITILNDDVKFVLKSIIDMLLEDSL